MKSFVKLTKNKLFYDKTVYLFNILSQMVVRQYYFCCSIKEAEMCLCLVPHLPIGDVRFGMAVLLLFQLICSCIFRQIAAEKKTFTTIRSVSVVSVNIGIEMKKRMRRDFCGSLGASFKETS